MWAALALIPWLRGDRRWKIIAPIVIAVLGLVGAAIAYTTLPGSSSIPPPTLTLDRILAVTSGVVGQLWSSQVPDIAMLAGTLTIILLVTAIALVVAARVRPRDAEPQAVEAAGWTGFAVHALLAAIMIAVSRSGVADNIGESGRYALLSGLAMCALLALGVILWRRLAVLPAVVLAVSIGLVTYTLGSGQATNVRNQYPNQAVLAVAMQLDAKNVMLSLRTKDSVLPAVKGLGAYPFTSDFTLGCGGPELGAKLDVATAPQLVPGTGNAPSGGYVESGKVTGDTMLSGWAVVDGKSADCVLVVDDHDNVVGGGYVGLPRPDVAAAMHTTVTGTGWHAVAAPNATNPQVVVMSGGKAYRLPVAPKQ
ncbi:hypothetical protein [Kutzneria kofuensis]|uniref:hypothetical protein n=1 Tax=Kutzneria kofuensis TaxID=103725 RepID=UPI0031F11C09